MGIKDKGNDVVELRRAGCRLLNVDTNQTFYRIAGGAANATYTALPSGNKYVCDDAGVVLVPCWLNADVNSLLGLGQGLTVNGIA